MIFRGGKLVWKEIGMVVGILWWSLEEYGVVVVW